MSDITLLNSENIENLGQLYIDDPHFNTIVKPRILFLNKLQDLFIEESNLSWQINYSPTHRSSNCVRITLKDAQKKFAFYYQIPLLQRFELHLYLGNNTFNFFEAYPFLIEKEVMKEDEYKVKATTQILPHMVLSLRSTNYQREFMDENLTLNAILDSNIYKNISNAFNQFNEALFNIIHSKWLL